MSNGPLDLGPEGSIDYLKYGIVGGGGSSRNEAEVGVASVKDGLPGCL